MSIALAVVAAVIVYVFMSWTRMNAWNADPDQRMLAVLLAKSVEDGRSSKEISEFVLSHSWSRREALKRIAHASSLLRGVMPSSAYREMCDVGNDVIANYRDDPA
jgi:hypothetical protein